MKTIRIAFKLLLLAGLMFAFRLDAAIVTNTFSTAGSGTWTVPAGVFNITVEVWGGGGGGGTRTSNGGGGGGGGGAYAKVNSFAVTPGTSYSYTVGGGGSAGAAGTSSTFNSTTCVAAGGQGVANNTATGGAGGLAAASTGDVKFNGGSGANANGTTSGGGGGGSGGSSSNGNYTSATTSSAGATAVADGGPGGAGATSQAGGNSPSSGPGGGGGGALRTSSQTRTGGAGYAGQIRISYTVPTFNIIATAGSGGSISPTGTNVVDYGTNQTYTITPNSGFVINQVLVDGSSIGVRTSYTFTNVTAAHTISASFVTNTTVATVGAGLTYTITTLSNEVIYTFTSGSGTFTPANSNVADILVVGGGGGGGGTDNGGTRFGGGGGAGGFVSQSGVSLTANNPYTVTVGAGGSAGTSTAAGGNGGNSVFNTTTATGGGGGGSGVTGASVGIAGGSGGGGGRPSGGAANSGGAGTSGQGNLGATSASTYGGGGGGASAAGSTQNGGNGTASSISGISVTYAGGGGGGNATTAGTGGTGGGGAGASAGNGAAGTVNTGGGGGGGAGASTTRTGGAGGSGVVIVSVTIKATPTATLAVNNSPATYNGSAQPASVVVSSSSTPGTVSNVKYDGSATVPTNAGTYAITAVFVPTDSANFYTLTNLSAGNFIINKATPTATLTVSNSPQTYNGTAKAATVSIVSSSVSGSVSGILTGGAASQTNAGTYAVTATFVPTDTANYNSLTGLSAGNFVINKATPTLSVTNSPTTYTGTAKSAGVAASVPGTVSSILTGGATTRTNAGTYAVTANFTPTDTVNYNTLTAASAGNFVIDAVELNVSPVARTVVFDGSTLNKATYSAAVTNYTITGFQNGETASSIGLTFTGSMAFNGSTNTTVRDVGTNLLGQGTLAFGSSITNYFLNFNNSANNSYAITAKTISVTGVTANNKTADGTTTATLNFAGANLVGVVSPDVVTLNTNSAAGNFATASAGTQTVNVSGLALSDTNAANYTLTQPTTTATIFPAALNHYAVTFSAAPYYVDVPFTTIITAKDIYNNTVTSTNVSSIQMSSSSASVAWDADGHGSFYFSGPETIASMTNGVATISTKCITLETNVTITATDANSITGTSAGIDFDSEVDAYRTQASGNWSNAAIWQRFDGSNWVAATTAPTHTNGVITIQTTNQVTVTADLIVDQVHLDGRLTVNTGVTLVVTNGAAPAFENYGSLTNNGTLVVATSAGFFQFDPALLVNSGTITKNGTMRFFGGTYQHAHTTTAGTIPAIVWQDDATCAITGYTSNTNAPAGLGQRFLNFIWDCPAQAGAIDLGSAFTNADNFTVSATGTGSIALGANLVVTNATTVSSGATCAMGSYVLTGSSFTLSAGATLNIGSAAGITTSGATGNIQTASRSFSSGANYIYSGTSAQVTGNGLPATVYSLVDNNSSATLTLSQAETITTNLTIATGAKIGLPNGSTSTAYTLFINGAAKAAGSWGSSASPATHQNDTYFDATLTGVLNVTYGVIAAFSNLSPSDDNHISYGDHILLSGTLSAPGPIYPADGETITVTVDGNAQTTTTTGGNGSFSINYNSSTIAHSNLAPHYITYSYAGSDNLNPATNDSTFLQVQAAPLTIEADDAVKVYGETVVYGAGSTNFSSIGLKNGETIGSVTITSTGGTNASAPAGNYTLTPSNATGGTFNPGNYEITYVSGSLQVNPALLTITANDTNKVYGTTLTFNGDEFSSVGLLPGDSITSVSLTSSGAAAAASAGTYNMVPSAAIGTGLTNYTITYLSGTLTVSKATSILSVTSSLNPIGYRDAVNFTATVPADATGSIVFTTTNAAFSTNALSGGSATSLSITNLPRGTNIIIAQYAGDVNYLGSTNALPLGQIVTNHPPVAATLNYNNSVKSFKMTIANLLTNATDVDGDTLTLAGLSVSTNGVAILTNATLLLYNNTSYVSDQFNYYVNDGFGGTATGTVNVVFYPFAAGQGGNVVPVAGKAQLKYFGIPNYKYSIQRSTNMVSWLTILTTNAPASGKFTYEDDFADLGAPPASAYYRQVWTP